MRRASVLEEPHAVPPPPAPPRPLPSTPGLYRSPNPYLQRQARTRPQSAQPNSARPFVVEGAAVELSQTRPVTARAGPAEAKVSATDRKEVKPRQPAPAWVTKDREVLRYYAFFQEPVYEGGNTDMAGFRVRRFVICYYTANGQISIEEPRTTNSGLQQGTFMRKQAVPKTKKRGERVEGEFLTPVDFAVGGTLEIYGRVFKIVDADVYTRDYHERELKRALGPAEHYPDDGYESKRAEAERRRRHVTVKKPVPFIMRKDKVLRFFCAYQDERKTAARRQYNLYYYLNDDTAEIKEVKEQGYDGFTNFLKRQRIPKDSSYVPMGDSERNPQRPQVPSYTWEDLRCGQSIKVYGRHLLLMSCDASTKEWYASNGVNQVPLQMSTRDSAQLVTVKVAPRNGFGTDDDLFALGLKLEPCRYEDKQAKAERSNRDSRILRFVVHLMRGNEEDTSRYLILNWYEFDDSISIFEPPARNTGIPGGLFLSRGKYKKHIERAGVDRPSVGGSLSRYLRLSDFLLEAPPVTLEDASTGVRLFTVKTVDYDEHSRKILDEELGQSTHGRLVVLLETLSEAFVTAGLPVRSIFRAADTQGVGWLSRPAFVGMVRDLEAQAKLTPAGVNEVDVIVKRFSSAEGQVFYDDFVDAVSMCAPRSVFEQAKEAIGAATMTLEEHMFRALAKCFKHTQKEGAGELRRTLRTLDKGRKGGVDMPTWFQALKEQNLMQLFSRTAASSLVLHYDTQGVGELSYKDLCDTIFNGDFDLPAVPEAPLPPPPPKAPAATAADRASDRNCNNNNVNKSPMKAGPPTIKTYLADLTDRVIKCEGNKERQLEQAMMAFSSAFSRLNRKRILRKIWMAFDAGRSGRITQAQFYAAITQAAVEAEQSLSDTDTKVLGEFLFPDAKSKIPFESLLDAIGQRDIRTFELLRDEGRAAGENDDMWFGGADEQRQRDFGGTLRVVGEM